MWWLISLLLFAVITIVFLIKEKGIVNLLENYEPEIIMVVLLMCLITGFFTSSLLGILWSSHEDKFEKHLVEIETIHSYKETDNFSLGFDGQRYMYFSNSDDGKLIKFSYAYNTYINATDEKLGTKEVYEYKYKNKLYEKLIKNFTVKNTILNLPKGYEIIEIK